MDSLTPSLLLTIWEQGFDQPSVAQALLLLSAARPDEAPAALAHQSLGQRNRMLLALRERLFGARCASTATCPACGERLEFAFLTAELGAAAEQRDDEPLAIDHAGYSVRVRVPNSADLLAVGQAREPAALQAGLLQRCVLDAAHAGTAVASDELPEAVAAAIMDALEAADPLALIELALACPACGQGWRALLDIASYLWRELDAWARRTLREVHILAATYGWSEESILAMRPERRQIYLNLIGR